MGSQTQRSYDLGFNLRYLDTHLISITIGDFTGYFSNAMPFAYKVRRNMVIAEDRMWGDKILRHVDILKVGRFETHMADLEEFKILWRKALNKNIINAASEIAKFRMGLIEQEYEANDSIRVRRRKG